MIEVNESFITVITMLASSKNDVRGSYLLFCVFVIYLDSRK